MTASPMSSTLHAVARSSGTVPGMTRTGTMPDQGDVLLIPVPFTDLTSQRRRPVIVISNNDYNRATADVVVVAMTSNPAINACTFTITQAGMEAGTLKRPSQVRSAKIYTLAQSIVIHKIGRVKATVLDRIRTMMQDLVS